MTLPRWASLLVAISLGAAGCTRTMTVPVLYRLPLRDNSHGAEAARTCARACAAANERNESSFYYCLSMCPDIQVRNGATCTDVATDVPPEAYCYTRMTEEQVADPEGAAVGLAVFLKLAELGVAIATHDGHHGHHRHSR